MKKNLLLICLVASLLFAGCGSSRDFNDISGQQGGNINVPNAPVAQNQSYTTNSNTQLVVNAADGVLADITQTGVTAIFPTTTDENGTVAGNPDGSFVYTPVANFSGSDSFTFTARNSAGESQATVTITVVAVNGFFVDATNGNDGTGSFTNGRPFQTIQAAVTAAGTGEDIVVRAGNYNETVTLLNNQRLLGAGSDLVNAQGGVLPVLTGSVVLADGNTVDSLRIANAPGRAIDATDRTGGTVTNCEIDTTSAAGSGIIGFPIAGGNWNVSNNVIMNVSGSGVVFTTEGTSTAVVRINNNNITGSTFNAIGFITGNGSDLRAQVRGNQMSGNQAGFTFEVIAGGASTSIYDIEDNTNDDTYRITQNASATGTLEVEEYDNLIAVNNNSGTKTVGGGGIAPASVPNGTAGFTN